MTNVPPDSHSHMHIEALMIQKEKGKSKKETTRTAIYRCIAQIINAQRVIIMMFANQVVFHFIRELT